MASASFDSSGWSHYAEITWDNAKVDNLNDNLMYDLSLLDSTWWNNQAVSDGGDVRITNEAGDTAYSFELENFNNNGDGTGTGILFHDSSKASSTTSDESWLIWCGNSSASLPAETDTLGAQNVWNSYSGVYHLNQEPTSNTAIKDSAGNYDSTDVQDNMTSGDLVTENIGKAIEFDGSDDYIEVGSIGDSTGDFAYSIWIRSNGDTSGGGISNGYIRGGDSKTDKGIYFNSSSKLSGLMLDTPTEEDVTKIDTTNDMNDNNWHYSVITWDGSTFSFYVDGSLVGTDSRSTVGNDATYVSIGGDRNADAIRTINGANDEARVIEGGTLSANWISTEYNNQSSPSTFWTTGSTQTASQAYTQTSTDTLTLGDVVSKIWNAVKSPKDTLSLSTKTTRSSSFSTSKQDTASVKDKTTRQTDYHITLKNR